MTDKTTDDAINQAVAAGLIQPRIAQEIRAAINERPGVSASFLLSEGDPPRHDESDRWKAARERTEAAIRFLQE